MKTNQTDWVKFSWPLNELSISTAPVLPEGYEFRIAAPDQFNDIINTIINAYGTDPIWKNLIEEIRIRMTERVGNTLVSAQNQYLTIFLNREMAAVSGICQYHWTNQNFLTGICVKKSYQRRGLGTFLLYHSLQSLQKWGLDTAVVFTEKHSVADEKIYPLYHSTRTENAIYLSDDTQLHQVQVSHNIYFGGKVQSLGIQTETGYATVGVIKSGEYQFSTISHERVHILKGSLEVNLPGKEWKVYRKNEGYMVRPGVTFKTRCKKDVLYLCYYN